MSIFKKKVYKLQNHQVLSNKLQRQIPLKDYRVCDVRSGLVEGVRASSKYNAVKLGRKIFNTPLVVTIM